ncbi:granulocyte-macrophage colony-stimulating factor receptor subunit alpha isoform X2 [Prionailurus iriomotensis]
MGLPRPPSCPLGPLATTILFCMLLDSALPLTQEQQDVPTTEWVPSLNMKFDRRTMELSWECKENTTYLECVMIHKEKGEIRKKPKNKDCHCNFSHDSLHGGVTFVVKVNSTQGLIPEKLVYANPGGEGTAAQNFSCFIYNVNFMNCTWAKGRAAPDDVQYFLYIQDFNQIYSPPNNVSVDCNPSHCQILWDPPRTRHPSSAWDFNYQLRIQKQNNKEHAGNQLIDVTGKSENKYNFPSPEPRPKHTVTIRASDARGQHWSAWSQPVEFGSTQATASFVHVYVLVVLGTFVCALILSCLVKRLFASETLFPRIPHVKDKWSENVHTDHQIIWEKSTPDTGKIDHEEILTVEEVTVAPESV